VIPAKKAGETAFSLCGNKFRNTDLHSPSPRPGKKPEFYISKEAPKRAGKQEIYTFKGVRQMNRKFLRFFNYLALGIGAYSGIVLFDRIFRIPTWAAIVLFILSVFYLGYFIYKNNS